MTTPLEKGGVGIGTQVGPSPKPICTFSKGFWLSNMKKMTLVLFFLI